MISHIYYLETFTSSKYYAESIAMYTYILYDKWEINTLFYKYFIVNFTWFELNDYHFNLSETASE